jgi:hypothetical protein
LIIYKHGSGHTIGVNPERNQSALGSPLAREDESNEVHVVLYKDVGDFA